MAAQQLAFPNSGEIKVIPFLSKLNFGDTPLLNAEDTIYTESDEILCGFGVSILLRSEYSASDVLANLRISYLDESDNEMISEEVTPDNTHIAVGANFQGGGIVVPTFGAFSFKVILTSTPSNGGTISVWSAVI